MHASLAIASWGAVVLVGALIAWAIDPTGRTISIQAPPLHARFQPVLQGELAIGIAVGLLAVVALPSLARRLSWRALLVASGCGSATFGLALAAVRGSGRIVGPVLARREYLAALPGIDDAGAFLATFTDRLPHTPVHVQGHPPGTLLVALGLRDLGLSAPGWFAAVLIVGGAVVAPAALVVVREVAGEGWGRRAMPFLVVSPAAVWLVTSADALFAGVGAVGIALVVAATARARRRRDLLALAGGVVLGLTIFLSYGLVLLAAIPLVIAWRRRTLRPIALAALGGICVIIAFAAAGFWWLDGLAATRTQYFAGIASRRSYLAFLGIDLAAFALVVGPATAVGLARLRSRRLWLVVGGGLAMVALAALSGMAKGEVERIWLPFAPWVVVAAAATSPAAPARGGVPATARTEALGGVAPWIAMQAAVAILIEGLIRTPW